MAVSIGTLTGEISLVDNASSKLATFTGNLDAANTHIVAAGAKSDILGTHYTNLGTKASDLGAKIASGATAPLAALSTTATGTAGTLSGLITKVTSAGSALGGLGSLLLAGGAIGAISSIASTLMETASAAFSTADALVKMSDKTGIGVESLGKLQAVATASGNTVEQIAGAVNRFQKALGEGSKLTVGAIGELGLSVVTLKGLKPEDQFAAIAKAISAIPDPAKQAQLAMELFGRAGADLLPTLKADIQGISDGAVVMSEQTVRNLDAAGDAWASFKLTVTSAVGGIIGAMLEQSRVADLETTRMLERLRDVNGALERLPTAPGKPTLNLGNPLAALGLPSPEMMDYLDNQLKNLTKSSAAQIAAQAKGREEAKRAAAETTRLTDATARAAEAGRKHTADVLKQVQGTQDLTLKTRSLGDALNAIGGTTFVPTMKDVAGFSLRSATDIGTLALSVDELERGGRFTEAALRKMGLTIGTLPEVTGAASGSFEEATTKTTTWGDSLTGLARSFELLANVSGDAFGGVVKDIATVVAAMSVANDAGKMMASSGWANKVSGAIAGYAALNQATNSPNKAVSIGGGAATGAVMGNAIVPGGWGAVGGAIGGAIYGYLKSRNFTAVMAEVGRNWGVTISKALGDEIKKTAKTLFDGSRQAAGIFELNKIVSEAGGLTSSNLEMFTGRLRDVFVMLETGTFNAAQAVEVLDENWAAFAEAGTDANGRLSGSLKEILRLAQGAGLESKAMTEYLKGQGSNAIAGFTAVVTGSAMSSKQALSDLGIQAVASITAAVAAGMSMSEALRAAAPALKALSDGYAALGLGIDNAAVRSLLFQSTILEGNPTLIAAIEGLSGSMIALDNMGLLNVETFGAMQRTGTEMYTRLQAAADAAGGTTRDALVPMQQWLHDAAEQATLLGVPLDENTQMLIDQSKELGIWKDKGKDATSKLTDGMQSLVDKVAELIDKLSHIPDVDVNINGRYNPPSNMPGGGGEIGLTGGTGGRLVDFGPRGTVVTLHNRERVQTEAEVKAADRGSNVVDITPLLVEQRRLNEFLMHKFGPQLAKSVRDENQKAVRR